MSKGYGIFSGGLDSLLSVLLLKDQGHELVPITFTTPFFDGAKALASGRSIGIEPRVVDVTADHLVMMQNPKHGFGRFMNPCIDCHALMFRRAGEIMTAEGGDFLFSGEVLGQRPKSQTHRALDIVARESGYAGLIVRPLCARALPPSRPELEGLVDREGLKGFTGRTRKPQMELAAHYGLTDYPAPAGGCLLADPVFSRRLAELYAHNPEPSVRDIELLKTGRHFRLPGGTKAAVGRNEAENNVLQAAFQPGDAILTAADAPGPDVLLPGLEAAADPDDLALAAAITASYGHVEDGRACRILVWSDGKESSMTATSLPKKEFVHLMIA